MPGPTVLQHDEFTDDITGEQVNRLVLSVNGHTVQIVQTDNDPRVLVLVDDILEALHIDDAAPFIESRTA